MMANQKKKKKKRKWKRGRKKEEERRNLVVGTASFGGGFLQERPKPEDGDNEWTFELTLPHTIHIPASQAILVSFFCHPLP